VLKEIKIRGFVESKAFAEKVDFFVFSLFVEEKAQSVFLVRRVNPGSSEKLKKMF
jgi:hypothetical protein